MKVTASGGEGRWLCQCTRTNPTIYRNISSHFNEYHITSILMSLKACARLIPMLFAQRVNPVDYFENANSTTVQIVNLRLREIAAKLRVWWNVHTDWKPAPCKWIMFHCTYSEPYNHNCVFRLLATNVRTYLRSKKNSFNQEKANLPCSNRMKRREAKKITGTTEIKCFLISNINNGQFSSLFTISNTLNNLLISDIIYVY